MEGQVPLQLQERLEDRLDEDDRPGCARSTRPAQVQLPDAPASGLVQSLERRRLRAYLGLLTGDVIILLGTFYAVSVLYFGTFTNWLVLDSGMIPAYAILPLYLTIALYNRTYSRRALTEWQTTSLKAIIGLVIAAGLLNMLAFFAKSNAEFSRLVFTVGLTGTAMMMVAMRIAVTRLLTRKWGPTALNRLVIHAGGPRFSLPHAVRVDAVAHGLVPDLDDPEALDRLGKYLRHMDEVIVSRRADDRLAWSQVLKGTGIHGEIIHQLSREIGAIGVVHHDAADITTLKVSAGRLGMRARAAKRLFDLTLALAALIVLAPLFAAVALAIKLEDGGPIFFSQRRIGRGNGFFHILKFRSMREADALGARSTARNDDRITRVGRMIRRTSIDELPQLINVVLGDMSIVGPRPHALGSTAGSRLFWQIDRSYWQRHGLRPGITGLAQVRGHRGATENEGDLTLRLQADLEYLAGWSMWRDLGILLATLRVLTHERAF